MVRRTKAQWHELFEAQQSSGQTNAAFCRQHKLNPKYFSLRKQQLGDIQKTSFVLAQPCSEQSNEQIPTMVTRLRIIDIELGASPLDIKSLATTLNHLLQ
jgi:hypothetical protein